MMSNNQVGPDQFYVGKTFLTAFLYAQSVGDVVYVNKIDGKQQAWPANREIDPKRVIVDLDADHRIVKANRG